MEPWDTIQQDLPGWSVVIKALEGVMGFCDIARQQIVVDLGLTERERRSTIMHEVVHALYGHTGRDEDDEQQAQRVAAKLLLPAAALAAVLIRAPHPEDVCDALDVDLDTLQTRIRTMPAADRHEIRRALTTIVDHPAGSTRCAIGRWWDHYQQPDPHPCDLHGCRLADMPLAPAAPSAGRSQPTCSSQPDDEKAARGIGGASGRVPSVAIDTDETER